MSVVDSFDRCIDLKRYYDSVGYPDVPTAMSFRSCGNDLLGIFLFSLVGLLVLYKAQITYDARYKGVKKEVVQ